MSEVKKTWKVENHRVAEKGIHKLPADLRATVLQKIKDLRVNPRPHGSAVAQGYDDLFRIRVGSYRIIYAIINDLLLVLVLEISPRGQSSKGRY